MDIYDPEKTAEIWRRVQGNCQSDDRAHSLLELIQEERTDAAIYLQLSRLIPGQQGRALRLMSEQEQSHAACLKGIYTLMTGQRPAAVSPCVRVESAENMLRRCYGREMRCLVKYESRSGDPEYGKVFSRLALQEQEHCRMILEIIGTCRTGI